MANHLIIGLGGTGGNILREMRKRIYEEFRNNEPDKNTRIEYLYVDSSPADLNDRSGWKTMGGSVHLMEAQKVSIHGVGSNVLNNLHQYPGIQSFINNDDRALLDDISSLISDGIGGQRRRLGRLLFANNLSGPADKSFTQRVQTIVQKLANTSTDSKVDFHICAGLAGGTGSGSIIDAIAQVSEIYTTNTGHNPYKIFLYLYVPEMLIANPKFNSGYYQANGYAALSELNAMSTGNYKPLDSSGKHSDEFGNVKRFLNNSDAFEIAYLFSNVNEKDRQLQISTELPAAAADFLFQKIVAADMTNGGQMARLTKSENEGNSPERDGTGAPVHGRRFMSFGVKRIEYPETEVEEFVTYSFARQAGRQLQYNLWRDGIGFEECSSAEVGMGFQADIKEKKTQEALLLSDNYLTLSKPLIDNVATKKWKEIASGWENVTQFYADDAQAESNKKRWLGSFSASCELQFNSNYRGQGVKDFYKIQRGEKNAYAAYVRRHIEEVLFNEWHAGTKSMLEIEKYAILLIEDCDSKTPLFLEKIVKYENFLEQETIPEIKRCNSAWNNIGWIRDAMTNASSKVFSSYKTAKCELYTLQTRIEGYRYGIELVQAVKNELEQMLNHVSAFKSMLDETLQRIDLQIDAKCSTKTDSNATDNKITKKYDPAQVRETTHRFVIDEQRQKHNASQIRGELVGLLGEDGKRSFYSLTDKLDISNMEDMFVRICLINATSIMVDLAKADPSQKMLNVNILEKIKQEYNTDERLEDFITSMANSAQCYLQFNSEEMAKVLPSGKSEMMRMVQLCLPEYNDPTNFRQKFIEMFAAICPGFDGNSDLSLNYKSNQIVIVAAASGFPLRFVSNVKCLKDKYDELMIGSKATLNRMVLHTESNPKFFPSLFEKSIEEKRKEMMPIVLLVFAMDLPIDKTDPTTGETFKAIEFKDISGIISNWTILGKNISQAIDKLAVDAVGAQKVSALVENMLATTYLHNDQKTLLQTSIANLMNNQILQLCGNNDLDPQYQVYKNVAVNIIQNKLTHK